VVESDAAEDAKEYVAQGQTFQNSSAALKAVSSQLGDLDERVQEGISNAEKTRNFLKRSAGIKDAVTSALADLESGWEAQGLDSSSYLVTEVRDGDDYQLSVEFRPPFTEYIWLTGPQGNNITESGDTAFLTFAYSFQRGEDKVTAEYSELQVGLNLPTFRGSPELVREGMLRVKKELELNEAAKKAAYNAKESATEAVKKYCADKGMSFAEPKAAEAGLRPNGGEDVEEGWADIADKEGVRKGKK